MSLQCAQVVKYMNQFGGIWQGFLQVSASGFQVWILLAFPQTLPEDQSLGRLLVVSCIYSLVMLQVIVASISLLLDVDEGDVGGRVGIRKLKDKPPGVAGVAVNPGRLPPGPAGGEL